MHVEGIMQAMTTNKKACWYAPKETAEDPMQMGLYAVASYNPYPTTSFYFEDLYTKIKSELETEITQDGISTVEIIGQLSSSFELNPFFDEAQIAASISERMQNRLQDYPMILVQVYDEDALTLAQDQTETPQAIAYQSVCELPTN